MGQVSWVQEKKKNLGHLHIGKDGLQSEFVGGGKGDGEFGY